MYRVRNILSLASYTLMGRNDVSVLDLMCKDRYAEANNHKRARDQFSLDAKNWAAKRDLYRERSKQEYAEAIEIKKKRDELNAKVKEAKAKRDEWQAKAAQLKESKGPEYDEARAKGNEYHEQMVSFNEKGQEAHQRYVALMDQSKTDRTLADAAHNKFIECRKASDTEHKLYVRSLEAVKNLRDNLPDFDGSEDDA